MERKDPAQPEEVKDPRWHHRNWAAAAVIVVLLVLALTWTGMIFGEEEGEAMPCFGDPGEVCMVVMGGGRVDCRFRTAGDQVQQKLGAMSVRVYESVDGEVWTLARTYRAQDYPFMLSSNDDVHQEQLSFYGIPGRYYKACVVLWNQGADGSQGSSLWTREVQA